MSEILIDAATPAMNDQADACRRTGRSENSILVERIDERILATAMASEHSSIEWTEATWNPTSGCTKVSPRCDRCYAERITRRFPQTFPNGFALTLRPDALNIPLGWRRPRTIFVNSMSDLFHVDVPEEYLRLVFEVMRVGGTRRAMAEPATFPAAFESGTVVR